LYFFNFKKIFLKYFLTFIAAFCSLYSYAQTTSDKKFKVKVNAGMFSDNFIKQAKSNKLSVFEIPVLGQPAMEGSGIYSAEILSKINKHFEAGISFSYQNIKVNSGINYIEYRVNYVAIMPMFYYKYSFRKVGYYYSGAAAGIGFLHYKFENDQKVRKRELEYQATLLGLAIGNRFTVVTEIGYGCKVIFQLGFSYKL